MYASSTRRADKLETLRQKNTNKDNDAPRRGFLKAR